MASLDPLTNTIIEIEWRRCDFCDKDTLEWRWANDCEIECADCQEEAEYEYRFGTPPR